jgi:hypothetical protein
VEQKCNVQAEKSMQILALLFLLLPAISVFAGPSFTVLPTALMWGDENLLMERKASVIRSMVPGVVQDEVDCETVSEFWRGTQFRFQSEISTEQYYVGAT